MRYCAGKVLVLIELAETKKVMTKTIKSLDAIANVNDAEISNLADQIRSRLDREDARQEIATMKLSEDIEEAVDGGRVESQLDERRRRLLGDS